MAWRRFAPFAALLLGACAIIPQAAEPGGSDRPTARAPVPPPVSRSAPAPAPPPVSRPQPSSPIRSVPTPEPRPAPPTPAPRPTAPPPLAPTPPTLPPDEALALVDAQPMPPLPDRDYDYQPTPLLHLSVPASAGANALGAGVRRGPSVASLLADGANAARALHAFQISCPSLVNREDRSGLTGAHDWVEACRAAQRWPRDDALDFFARHFVTAEIGDGRAFATGYYEPEIAASRTRRAGYESPIYGRPADLVQRSMPRSADRSGRPEIGRYVDSELVDYHDRAAIEGGALAEQGLEIAWARDPVDLFFMHVQGSGLLRLPDGSAMRVGYAGNNGYDYVSIGALMRDRGLIDAGETTAQGIAAWLRAHPDEARGIMHENPRYIFMATNDAPAPSGALAHYVTAHATVAADPNYVPMGAPVFLDIDQDVADGLWVAQDTGGAIRGANRFDTFWGAGEAALAIAGGMGSRGAAYVLIPRVSAERLPGF